MGCVSWLTQEASILASFCFFSPGVSGSWAQRARYLPSSLMEKPATSMGCGSDFVVGGFLVVFLFAAVIGGGRRIDGVLVFRDVDRRQDLEVVRRGFAAAQIEAEELGVFAALGEEEDRGVVWRPLRIVFSALVGGWREGELAGLVGAGGRGGHDPEMAGRAVGGGVGDGEENLFAVGREQRAQKGT